MARPQRREHGEGGLSDRFILRMIEAPAATSPLDGVLLVLTALAAAWGITYVAGGAGSFPPHLFYIPPSGIYRSTCSDRLEIALSKGDTFPPCRTHGAINWTLVRATVN